MSAANGLVLALTARHAAEVGPIALRLLQQLGDGIRSCMLVGPGALSASGVEQELRQRATVVNVPRSPPLWMQDFILPGADAQGPCLFARQHTPLELLAGLQQMAEHFGLPLRLREWLPDGGNLLHCGAHSLVGADHWNQGGVAALFPSGRAVHCIAGGGHPQTTWVRAEHEGAWQESIHLGSPINTRQPLFHLDLFVSPAGLDAQGRAQFLVGDPRWGAELMNGRRRSDEVQAGCDRVASDLRTQGFTVIRNPLPQVPIDDEVNRRRDWLFASSNNVLVDQDARPPIICLPLYENSSVPALAATDRENVRIWSELGFDVRPIEGCFPLARLRAGLHCLAQQIPAAR